MPKGHYRSLLPVQWAQLRAQYETGDFTLAQLAGIFGQSISTIQKRSAAEHWSKRGNLVADAKAALQKTTNETVKAMVDDIGQKIASELLSDLAPVIEREKRAQILRSLKRAKRGQKRLDKLGRGYQVQEPKTGAIVTLQPNPRDEAFIAASEDKYDNIIRRNLGMCGEDRPAGGINLNILANQAAVIPAAE